MNKIEDMLEALSNPDTFYFIWQQVRSDFPIQKEKLSLYAATRMDECQSEDDSIIMDYEKYELMIVLVSKNSEQLMSAYQQFNEHEKKARNKEVLAAVILLK